MFGVVADDLTGACDVGVQFRRCGLEIVVLADIDRLDSLWDDFDVVAFDTESRNVTPVIAYKRLRETVRALKRIGAQIVYKKIDSTLRGNLGTELDAVMDESDVKAAIVAPSFPAHNRITINGHLLVNSTPLERTQFARDPMRPIKESHIPALIGYQTKREIGHISLSKVRSGTSSLKDEIQRLIEAGNQIIVADAETQEDLAVIAEASVDSNTLSCGSAGLAAEVSRLLSSRLHGERLLVVSGSVNSVTLDQIATAEKELDVKVVEPDLSEVLMSKEKWENEVNNLAGEAEKAVREGRDIIIRLAKSQSRIFKVQKSGRELGMGNLEVTEKLLSVLSETFKQITRSHKFAGLVLVGGDTAMRIISVTGAYGIRIEKEVLPGIPVGAIVGGKHEGLRVVTKAGGFGDNQALVKIMKYLKGEE